VSIPEEIEGSRKGDTIFVKSIVPAADDEVSSF